MENHRVEIQNRERITITQVTDVDAFDENTLWANLQEGGIELTGSDLHIEKLDLQEGVLIVRGKMDSLSYTDRKGSAKKSLMERWGKK